MAERALRGTRLGATSYETDNGIDLAPRQDVEYSCPNGHRFGLPFSLEAEVPAQWECRVCGTMALRVDGEAPEQKPGKPARTHWDMLLERRTVADLEEVLAERLEVLRGGGMGFSSAGLRMASTARSAQTGTAQTGTALIDAATGAPSAARPTGTPSGRTAPATKKSPAKKSPAPARKSVPAKAAPASRRTAAKAQP
jgi:hypothetical protein